MFGVPLFFFQPWQSVVHKIWEKVLWVVFLTHRVAAVSAIQKMHKGRVLSIYPPTPFERVKKYQSYSKRWVSIPCDTRCVRFSLVHAYLLKVNYHLCFRILQSTRNAYSVVHQFRTGYLAPAFQRGTIRCVTTLSSEMDKWGFTTIVSQVRVFTFSYQW